MSKPFVPAFGGKAIVPGCSDKTPRDLFLAEKERSSSPVKLTTASRASAALEHYWQQQQHSSGSHAGNISACSGSVHSPHTTQTNKSQHGKLSSVPGGERELAHKTRDACWRDSVQLSHHAGSFVPDCEGVPKDIEEKETTRTRGIPGYTGCQPPPGASKPPELPQPVDASRWTAINAFDERRPRVKGIPGYTGHQPHTTTGIPAGSPQALNAAAAAAQSNTQQYRAAAVQGSTAPQQHYSSQQLPMQHAHPHPQATHNQGQHTSSSSGGSGVVQEPFMGGNPFASYAWKHCGQRQQQASLRQPPATDAGTTATAAAAAAGTGAAAAAYVYPQTAGLGSACASRTSSPPLYFCDRVQVPPGQVPIPPHSAAGSSHAGMSLTGGCSAAGCSMTGSGKTAVRHQAEVMVVDQGGSAGQLLGTAGGGQGLWPSSAGAAADGHSTGGHSTGGHATGCHVSSGQAGGQNGGGGGGGGGSGVRVGRPAVGPWCTTYSTTFVQQEAFKGLMRELQEAALQRQQGR